MRLLRISKILELDCWLLEPGAILSHTRFGLKARQIMCNESPGQSGRARGEALVVQRAGVDARHREAACEHMAI